MIEHRKANHELQNLPVVVVVPIVAQMPLEIAEEDVEIN
jgi:hypothetical protein